MAAKCSICSHQQTEAISLAILQHVTLREIAKKYGVSTSALQRHKDHIPKQLARSEEARHVAEAGSVINRIVELDRRADEIYQQASTANDQGLALKALKELREITGLYAKLAGEIQTKTVQHIHITPEWVSLRSRMLQALAPYPEARAALVKAIGGPEHV